MSLINRGFWDRILKKDATYHLFFWACLYGILVVLDNEGSFFFILVKELVNVIFFAVMVYTNIFFLFPTYMEKKNLPHHLLSLAVIALLITPIKTLALFSLSSQFGDFQGFFFQIQPSIFLSTFFIGSASSIYCIMSDWLTTQREKQELQRQTLQSELKFLKSQINPHFLFNTLNSLYALTLKKSDLAPEIVLKLSEMMRYMLYECNERQVPLEKEVNYLKNYLELEKLRHGKKMEVHLAIDGEIHNQKIAPLMFIPFIENSFKHGISNQVGAGFVDMHLLIEGDQIAMTIKNSKSTALPSSDGKKSGGIGLVNVRRRLNLLYPGNYELNISQDPNTYTVHLNLNLI